MDDEKWMKRALGLALMAKDNDEVPVGAVLVKGEEIVGRGWNRPISHHDPSAHAEIVAIRDAAKRLKNYRIPGTTLYVTIEPCTMCLGAIVHARISRVVFGAREPKSGVFLSHPSVLNSGMFNHSFEWKAGVFEEACRTLMQDFFVRRREQKKKLS